MANMACSDRSSEHGLVRLSVCFMGTKPKRSSLQKSLSSALLGYHGHSGCQETPSASQRGDCERTSLLPLEPSIIQWPEPLQQSGPSLKVCQYNGAMWDPFWGLTRFHQGRNTRQRLHLAQRNRWSALCDHNVVAIQSGVCLGRGERHVLSNAKTYFIPRHR